MNLVRKILMLGYTVLITTFFACNDDLLERGPLTQVSPEEFFKTKGDLKTYVNQYYAKLPNHRGWGPGLFGGDNNSDNTIHIEGGADYRLAGRNRVPSDGGGYSWRDIRSVNYFFSKIEENFKSSTDDDVKQYIGEAYFFRAWFYFELLKRFGDLPWIDKPLKANIKELALERVSRQVIADKIIEDLDKAIANMREGDKGESNRLNKYIAMAFKARVCLYEGTWEKYHNGTPFGVTTSKHSDYMNLAIDATNGVINSKKYALHKGASGEEYISLFNKTDYSSNSEVLLWAKNSVDLQMTHNMNRYIPHGNGPQMTKSLVNAYLMKNGKAITEASSGYGGETGFDTDGLIKRHNLMKGRDPRLVQMAHHIGRISIVGSENPTQILSSLSINLNNRTGFPVFKGGNTAYDQLYAGNIGTVGAIIFRYAEVLLIYAEAQAELGKNTEAVAKVDMLRERVGMVKLSAVMPAGSDVLKEVRRERRVELACEGFRMDDLLRWREAHLLKGKRFKGVKYKGNADLEARYTGTFKPVVDVSGKISENALIKIELTGDNPNAFVDTNGFLDPYQESLPAGFAFDETIDYLLPINKRDITLSEGKLKQNPGWDKRAD